MENEQIIKYASMIANMAKNDGYHKLYNIFENADYNMYVSYHDNWNYGTDYYTFEMAIDFNKYKTISNDDRMRYEELLKQYLSRLFDCEGSLIGDVKIISKIELVVDWTRIGDSNKKAFFEKINEEKDFLIKIGTGKLRIEECNLNFIENHQYIIKNCSKLMINPPFEFKDGWEWYHYYSKNLKSYQSRRDYINGIYNEFIEKISSSLNEEQVLAKTGFDVIDGSINELIVKLNNLSDSITINEIGLRCRQTLILLAQQIYDDNKHHPSSYSDKVSPTDSKRMIEGFIEYELGGSMNEVKRKYLKATNDFANELTHKQNPSYVEAKMCVYATLSLIQQIKIIMEK